MTDQEKFERRNINTITERIRHLEAKVSNCSELAYSHHRRELAALNWALAQIRVVSDISNEDREILYLALRRNDGPILCPDWDRGRQKALTAALDRLRAKIRPMDHDYRAEAGGLLPIAEEHRPDWICCIGVGPAGLTDGRRSWCGGSDRPFFVDINHAAMNGNRDGRLVACPKCVDAVVSALRNGTEESV